ncbi:Uncharacterised protein [Halioglobus japonicus]|nr:Uncharacterised protein [Halioglobus japonicus]
MISLISLAALAGILIAVQAGMNAQLGVLLHSPLLASLVAFSVSAAVTMLLVLFTDHSTEPAHRNQVIPAWLWLGGLLSAGGVGLFYYLIPRMGAGPMMSVALTSQLTVAMMVSHFGWFDLPETPLNMSRAMGLVALLSGIYLVNGG